jgi:hypothetical protein
VEDDAAIWPAIVERRLQETRPLAGVSTYEVLNGGIAGSLTDKWVALYHQQRALFQPDLVLAVFFLRDGTRLEDVSEPLAAANLARIRADPLARISTAYRYFRERWLAIHFAGQLERFFVDSYVGGPEATAEWRRARRNLLTLRDIAAADGARFGVATFPMLYGFDRRPYPFQPAMDAIERFCGEHDIAHHSLLPAFRGRRAADLWVSEVNKHPNAAGHAIAADALLPFVRRLMGAPPASTQTTSKATRIGSRTASSRSMSSSGVAALL